MTLDLSTAIADDCAMFDGVQTVTLTQPGQTADSVASVVTSPITRKQLDMLGGSIGVQDQTQAFSLPVENLSLTPHQGDTITDATSVVWRILSAELRTLDTRWLCLCIRNK